MFPGLTTRLSGSAIGLTTTISPTSDLVRITNTTSTTVLATITPPFGGHSGILFLYNGSGANAFTTVTTGNIQTARSVPGEMVAIFIYSHTLGKWLVGPIS